MLGNADRPIDEVLRFFTHQDLEVGLLVPTETGMSKSIMDAHGALRTFLRNTGVHDFMTQPQGSSYKVVVEATVLGRFELGKTTVSFYRPETKDGDPRTWIYGLQKWATAGNVIALFVVEDNLYLTNVSDQVLWDAREDPASPLGEVLDRYESDDEVVAAELASLIQGLAQRGWIPSGRAGDTGVGYTLETELGIAANSSRNPDFKGIELKSGRGSKGRASLFSQVPDWKKSAFSSAKSLLDTYGYEGDEGRLQLYCTNHARPNPQGFFMVVKDADVHCMRMEHGSARRVIQWSLPSLEDSLSRKHNSTFWVQADVCRDNNGMEYFHYRSIVHTRAAITANLGPLIDTGSVTLDLTLSERESGGVRDHGYLFRMEKSRHSLLFPPPNKYNLAPPIAPI